MKLFRLISGTLLLSLLVSAVPVHATTLYQQLLEDSQRAYERRGVDATMVDFMKAWFAENPQWRIDRLTDEQIQQALQKKIEVCGAFAQESPQRQISGCDQFLEVAGRLGADTLRLEQLGSQLQRIATSYELPVSDLPGRSRQISKDLRAIIKLWQAGTGSLAQHLSGAIIREVRVDGEEWSHLLDDVKIRLGALPDEERTAAVWRYQYGVRYVDGRRPFTPPKRDVVSGRNTERQYLFERWREDPSNIEGALSALFDQVLAVPIDPPLTSTEVAVIVFDDDVLNAHLPENVLVWARVDAPQPNGVRTFSDVGLQWRIPLHPSTPSLLTSTGAAILGGTYPPPPTDPDTEREIDGTGLCSDPVQARGYLCRKPLRQDGQCPVVDGGRASEIRLTWCAQSGSTLRTTVSGPDVCREVNFREEAFDPQRQCVVDIQCEPNCQVPNGEGSTSLKQQDGKIHICMEEDEQGFDGQLFRELHYAQQECSRPPEWKGYLAPVPPGANPAEQALHEQKMIALCCAMEGEAARAQGDFYASQHRFDAFVSPDGTPLNAETWAESVLDDLCGDLDNFRGCPKARTYSRAFNDAVEAFAGDERHFPVGHCSQILPTLTTTSSPDFRIVGDFLTAVNRHSDVCTPGTVSTYKNRIGNNLCFSGQCIEDSLELHRVLGGRSPATVQDEAFPFEDPLQGKALGLSVALPPETTIHLPSYNPLRVVRAMETAMCQTLGMPPLTPPMLCVVGSKRRLGSLLPSYMENVVNMAVNAANEGDVTARERVLPMGFGWRIGTEMYATFLQQASKRLAGVVRATATLLQQFSQVKFPSAMCPIAPPSALPPLAP